MTQVALSPSPLSSEFFSSVLTGDTKAQGLLSTFSGKLGMFIRGMRSHRAAAAHLQGDLDRLDRALHAAVGKGGAQRVRLLLQLGANPNFVDPETGNTAVHLAVQRRYLRCLEELLQQGGKVEARNSTGQTPLIEAAGLNWADGVALLLRFHADRAAVNDSGNTAGKLTSCSQCQALLAE